MDNDRFKNLRVNDDNPFFSMKNKKNKKTYHFQNKVENVDIIDKRTNYNNKKYTGAGIIFITHDLHVLLVQDINTGKWGFPKGHREDIDKNPLMTAVREVHEETGITSDQYEIIYESEFCVAKPSKPYIFYYALIHPSKTKIIGNNEIIEAKWFNIYNLVNDETLSTNIYLKNWLSSIRYDNKIKHIQILNQLVDSRIKKLEILNIIDKKNNP